MLQSQQHRPHKARKRALSLRKTLHTFPGPSISVLEPSGSTDSQGSNMDNSNFNGSEDDDHLLPPPLLRDSSLRKYSGGANSTAATFHIPRSFRRTSTSRNVDQTDTIWWGWVLLIITWVVFVIGMGSVLGIWDWVWYGSAGPPPRVYDEDHDEDDDLPIAGYYPALLILTTVVAWLWVVIAWVGMKYFRHARIAPSN